LNKLKSIGIAAIPTLLYTIDARELRENVKNLAIIETLLQSGLLAEKSEEILRAIQTLYSQQEEMYRERKHQIEDRIVCIHQLWVRPIVRGKTNAPTEFGAKIAISMVDGYAWVERLDWNAAERCHKERGYYRERIFADKIYRTRENLSFCSKHGIRMS
jgi:IS5 family transposase